MICARLKELDLYLPQPKNCFQIQIIQTDIGFGLAAF